MESATAVKVDEKKLSARSEAMLVREVGAPQAEIGATAGVPPFLQRSALTVSSPDDPYEKEADEVADRLHHRSKSGSISAQNKSQSQPATLPIFQRTPQLRTPDEGQPLSSKVRAPFEEAVGVDLSSVRIHTSPEAQQTAQKLHAKAFTNQNHIWLGPNQDPNDSRLLNHELTHVLQQSEGETDSVQRAPADYQHSEDGGAVLRRMQQRIDDATDEDARPSGNQTPQERAAKRAEARSRIHSVDRAEVNQEKGTLEPSAKPDVDRPAAEQPKVEQSAQETETQAETPGEPLVEGEKKEEKGKEKKEATPLTEAEAAAGMAEQAFSTAESFMPPTPDAPVMPPPPVAPIDAAGLPLPDNPEADMQASGLAAQAQTMREQGFNLRARASEERQNAEILRGNLGLVRSNLMQAEEGVSKSTEHLSFRRDLVGQANQALTMSQQKTQMVAEQAPEYSGKADEGKEESGPMATESRDLAAENAANTPDDDEAAARAQEQGGKMNQAGSDIATTDDAISQTKTRAQSLGEEAARASELNGRTEGKLTAMNSTLDQTNEKLGQMQQQNSTARSEMESLSSQPNQLRAQADALDQQGLSLIQMSFEVEQNVQQTQNEYASGMQSVPAPTEPEMDEAAGDAGAAPLAASAPEAESPIESTTEDAVVQRQPSDPVPIATPQLPQPVSGEAVSTAAEPEPEPETPPAESAGDFAPEPSSAPAESPMGGGAAPQPTGYEGRTNLNLSGSVTGALPSWLTGVPSPNEEQREAARLAEEERRRTRLSQIQARADEVGGFENLSGYDKAALALSMTRDNLFGSVGKIKWPGWGHLAAGLIDPRGPLMGVVSGLSMTLSGAANLFNLQQWKQDPLGNLLKSAADIATGLTIILGSITALAGVIIAIMTAITILSFGFAAPVTGPVIAFCTTVLTTVGGWTLAVGKVALILQALVFIKNLIDAACATSAQDLLTQSDQMTEDVSNAGNVVLQMGMAKLAQVGGRAAASEIQAAGGGVRFAAQLGARAGVGARALPGRIAAGVRGLPGKAVAGARALPGRALTGARALPGRVGSGLRSAGNAARGAGSRALSSARALPGRALAGARALPGRIATGVRGLPGAVRSAPGRVRQYLGERFNRNFIVGEGIPQGSGLRGAQAAATEARMNVFIDDLLANGAPIRHPSASSVARAQAALEAGSATPADVRVLVQKAVADARSYVRAGSGEMPLTWDVMKGACGPGRDVSASSFGTLAAESQNPILLQRFQAQEVFGINKHGFSVVTFPGEPPTRYLVDPTFGQFLRPGRATPTLTGPTAEVLRGDAVGSTFARNLARDGFVPLTGENATLYARALGVSETEAAAIGGRLSTGEGALTREVIGGSGPLPPGTQRGPIGRLTGDGPDILDVADSLHFAREHIARLQAQGDPGGVLPSLRALERRLADALRRGEGG